MNLRSSGSFVLSKAIQGFLSFKSAEGLSDRTIDSYDRLLQKWLAALEWGQPIVFMEHKLLSSIWLDFLGSGDEFPYADCHR